MLTHIWAMGSLEEILGHTTFALYVEETPKQILFHSVSSVIRFPEIKTGYAVKFILWCPELEVGWERPFDSIMVLSTANFQAETHGPLLWVNRNGVSNNEGPIVKVAVLNKVLSNNGPKRVNISGVEGKQAL